MTMVRTILAGSFVAATILIAGSLAGCGPTASPGQPGTVIVTVRSEAKSGFFEPIHRGRLIAPDGSAAVEWEVTEAGVPVEAPSGPYRLEVFTVFLSDSVQCTSTNSAGDPAGSCFQPTMGPARVCSLDVEVTPDVDVRAVFVARDEGVCDLTLETG